MKLTGKTKEPLRRRLIIASSALALSLFASGCAYTHAEILEMWNEVSREYPGCNEMPRIVTLDDGTIGGFYVVGRHTVVIDKYASDEIWKHEFRHACGDKLGEEEAALEGTGIFSLTDSYRRHTGQDNDW